MSFVGAIRDAFYALENPENARWMRQYMRNKYLFIGIKKPEQALVFKDIYKKYGKAEDALDIWRDLGIANPGDIPSLDFDAFMTIANQVRENG